MLGGRRRRVARVGGGGRCGLYWCFGYCGGKLSDEERCVETKRLAEGSELSWQEEEEELMGVKQGRKGRQGRQDLGG